MWSSNCTTSEFQLGAVLRCSAFRSEFDLEHFRPTGSLQEKLRARRELRLPSDKTIVLQVARLVGFDKADWEACIRIGAELAKSNVTLVMAGSDPVGFAGQLKALLESHGLARSIMVRPDVADSAVLYQAADVGLMLSNSLQETQGLAVLEAMASGLPVVASDWDGIRDTIEHGRTGWLIPTRVGGFRSRLWVDYLLGDDHASSLAGCEMTSIDVAGALRTLKLVTRDPQLRSSVALEARKYAEATFGLKRMMSRYTAAWAQMRATGKSGDHCAKRPVQVDWAPLFGGAYASEGVVGAASTLSVNAGRFPAWYHIGATHWLYLDRDRLARTVQALDGRRLTCAEIVDILGHNLGRTQEESCVLVMWMLANGVATVLDAGEAVGVGKHGQSREEIAGC